MCPAYRPSKSGSKTHLTHPGECFSPYSLLHEDVTLNFHWCPCQLLRHRSRGRHLPHASDCQTTGRTATPVKNNASPAIVAPA